MHVGSSLMSFADMIECVVASIESCTSDSQDVKASLTVAPLFHNPIFGDMKPCDGD
jgi:hypothetical protein